jgi:ATP-binding cassette subfamily A (ABC1) protein 1/ATP-binding cassette subfamily A (ABC1) protein 3
LHVRVWTLLLPSIVFTPFFTRAHKPQTKQKGPAYWASWGLTHWAALAASGALCAAAGLYPFARSAAPVMLLFYWLFGAALVAFGYAVAAALPTARVAGAAAQLVYAVSMVPG